MNANASKGNLRDKLTATAVDFASRAISTFVAVLLAGAILLIGVRLYVGWEANRAANQFERWVKEDEELQRKEAAAAAKAAKK